MSLGDIVVTLSLDDGKFTSRVDVASGKLDEFTKRARRTDDGVTQVERSTRRWGQTLRDTVVVIGMANHALHNLNQLFFSIPFNIIKTNAEVERMTVLMSGMSKEVSSYEAANRDAAETVKALFEQSARSPYAIKEVTDSVVKLRSAGIDLVRSQQALVDATAKYGGTGEQLKRASVAIQQMAGKGVISMEELRQQLAEAVPDAVPMMGRAMNVGMNEMIKAISLGRVGAKEALAALFQQMELEAAGSAEVFAATWDGTINRLKTSWTQAAMEIGGGKDGFIATLKGQMNDLIVAMKSPEFREAAHALGEGFAAAAKALGTLIGLTIEYREEIATLIAAYAAFKTYSALRDPTGGFRVMIREAREYSATLRNQYTNAVNAARDAHFGLNTEMRNGRPHVKLSGQNMTELAASYSRSAAAARGFGAAAATVGRSLWAAMGPFGLAVIAVSALTAAYSKLISHKNELARINELESDSLSKDQMETLRLEKEMNDRRIKQLEFERKHGRLVPGTQRWVSSSDERLKAIEEELKPLIASREEHARRLVAAERAAADRLSDTIKNESSVTIGAAVRHAAMKYAEAEKALYAEYEKLGKKRTEEQRAQYAKEKAALIKQRQDDIREAFQAEIDAREKFIAPFAKESEDTLIAGRPLSAYKDAIKKLREEMAKVENEEFDLSLFNHLDVDQEGRGKLSAFERLIGSYEKALTKLRAGIEETNPHLEELERRINTGEFETETKEELDHAREMARALWEQERAKKALTVAEEASVTVTKTLANMARDRDRALNSENPHLKAGAAAEKYRTEIEALIEKIQEEAAGLDRLGEQGSKAYQKIEERVRALNGALAEVDPLRKDLAMASIYKLQTSLEDSFLTESEKKIAAYERENAALQEVLNTQIGLSGEEQKRIRHVMELNKQASSMGAFGRMMISWKDTATAFNETWADAMSNFTSTLADAVVDGKANFADMANSILKQIVQITIRALITKAIYESMGWVSGKNQNSTPNLPQSTGVNNSFGNYSPSTYAFANGGIMTGMGSVPLQKYARGGIAHTPQLALFGEGSMPEAYVPLPDGRTIPVTIENNGSGQSQMPVVQVNVINQSGQSVTAEQGKPRFDSERMIMDVVLKNASQPGPFRDVIKAI